jgi:hypothetical protein
MSKIKLYLIGFAVVFVLTLALIVKVQRDKIAEQKAEITRVQGNNLQLMSENRDNINLQLTLREFKQSMSTKIDSILKVAEIASKQVKTVTITNTYYIDSSKTIIRPEPVISKNDTTYPFIDTKDCFIIGGFMKVVNERPELVINRREFKNEVTLIGYEKRPHKFWFIRWGKKEYFISNSSDCGKSEVKQIQIVKK